METQDEQMKQFKLNLSEKLFGQLSRIAKIDDRSVSATMRYALGKFVESRIISSSDVKRLLENKE